MISFATEENNTGGFYSHVSLVNPHKEGIFKRVCQSEPFMKPKLSLKMVRMYFKSKVPKQLRIGTVSKKNKSEQVRIERTSAKAAKEILNQTTANLNHKLSQDGHFVRTKMHKEFQSSLGFHEHQRKCTHQYNGQMCFQAKDGHCTKKCNIQDYYSNESLRNHWNQEKSRKVQSERRNRPDLPLKKPQTDPRQQNLSLEESKIFLREMATELYRVNQNPACFREEKTVTTLPKNNNSKQVRTEQTAINENAGGLQIPKKDWQNIMRPSGKVILDPNTANPALELSRDGRSVRTKTHKEYQSSQSYHEYYRKHEHQYNGWMCVQAQEGYSTGRHYWEVDVKGKCDWRVGVVKESAPRSGFVKLNTETGYWTLRLQLGSLMALTEPVTKLNQVPPSKIGVCLDLEEGQVSFYDAVKRKHIYTFKTEFKKWGNIYPVFGTVETDKPLKII